MNETESNVMRRVDHFFLLTGIGQQESTHFTFRAFSKCFDEKQFEQFTHSQLV